MSNFTNFKERMRNGEAMIGTMLSVFDTPDIVRFMKNNGIEWFFYDAEHGYPNIDRLYGIFGYSKMLGLPGFIRIPEVNKTEIFRALDMGADGIVCPNVESVETARELVRLAKYAPMGERGVSLTRPHTCYEKINAREYMDRANAETVIICQMESPKGVAALEEILQIDGVDGVLIGPNDLSQSMGILNQLDNPEYLEAVDKILSLCKKYNKFSGMPNKDLKELEKWRNKGVQLLQWGTDVSIFTTMLRNNLCK